MFLSQCEPFKSHFLKQFLKWTGWGRQKKKVQFQYRFIPLSKASTLLAPLPPKHCPVSLHFTWPHLYWVLKPVHRASLPLLFRFTVNLNYWVLKEDCFSFWALSKQQSSSKFPSTAVMFQRPFVKVSPAPTGDESLPEGLCIRPVRNIFRVSVRGPLWSVTTHEEGVRELRQALESQTKAWQLKKN